MSTRFLFSTLNIFLQYVLKCPKIAGAKYIPLGIFYRVPLKSFVRVQIKRGLTHLKTVFKVNNIFFFIIAGGHGAAGRGQHSFGHIDPFELFRSFFGTGDPFNAFDHFGMHHHHPHHLNTGRTDPWYRRHLLAKRLRIFCPKISPESASISADPKILQPLQRTTSCWL